MIHHRDTEDTESLGFLPNREVPIGQKGLSACGA
jgi:hypothetical protein